MVISRYNLIVVNPFPPNRDRDNRNDVVSEFQRRQKEAVENKRRAEGQMIEDRGRIKRYEPPQRIQPPTPQKSKAEKVCNKQTPQYVQTFYSNV